MPPASRSNDNLSPLLRLLRGGYGIEEFLADSVRQIVEWMFPRPIGRWLGWGLYWPILLIGLIIGCLPLLAPVE